MGVVTKLKNFTNSLKNLEISTSNYYDNNLLVSRNRSNKINLNNETQSMNA